MITGFFVIQQERLTDQGVLFLEKITLAHELYSSKSCDLMAFRKLLQT